MVAYTWMVETISTGIDPLGEVAKLKSIVGLLEKKYAFGLANIPEVDVEVVDGPYIDPPEGTAK